MIITFGQAKRFLSKYAGKAGLCPQDEFVGLFVQSTIQELLNRGANGSIRKWTLWTQNGMITLPPDLQLPTNIRIDGPCGGGSPGFVYDKFYEFYEESTVTDCMPFERGAVLEVNDYYTQYDPPACGVRILAIPRCREDKDAHIVVQGIDPNNLDIWVPNQGVKIKGEYLSICKDDPKYTTATFKKIGPIEKSVTKDYIRLYWYNPMTGLKGLLADLRPNETRPAFRRARIVGIDCNRCSKVTVLGRVRFYDNYVDSDIIPITSLRALKLMAQTLQAEDNDNIQVASYKSARVENVLDNENQYNRTPQAPVNFEEETAPGSIRNII